MFAVVLLGTVGGAHQLSAQPDPRQQALERQSVAHWIPPGTKLAENAAPGASSDGTEDSSRAEVIRYFNLTPGSENNVAGSVVDEARRSGWGNLQPSRDGAPGSATKTINGEQTTLAWWIVGPLDWGVKGVAPPYLVVDVVYDDGATGRPPR